MSLNTFSPSGTPKFRKITRGRLSRGGLNEKTGLLLKCVHWCVHGLRSPKFCPYSHVSARVAVVPAEFLDAFGHGVCRPMRGPGEPAHRTRRGRRGGGRRGTGGRSAAAALGQLGRCRRGKLVFGPGHGLLHSAHFRPTVGHRTGKHSGSWKRGAIDETKSQSNAINVYG